MMIEVKYFSKTLKKMYKITNIVLIALFTLLFILDSILTGLESSEEKQWLTIIHICIASVLLITNTIIFSIEAIRKAKVEKNITNFIKAKQYTDAIEYLSKVASINRFYNINQMILYYLGYLELLLDNPKAASTYLDKFDLENQFLPNSIYLAYTIFLLYIIRYNTNDSAALENIHAIYTTKKKVLLEATLWKKVKNEMIYLFDIIDFLNNKDMKQAKEKIINSNLIHIPMVERLISQKHCN